MTRTDLPAQAFDDPAPDQGWALRGDALAVLRDPREHSVGETTYRRIRGAIVRCELKPGGQLSEGDLAHVLGVSRTPVREALLRLSREGLVVVAPQRPSQVSLIDVRQLHEAQFVREILERSTLAMASRHPRRLASPVFDELIARQERSVRRADLTDFFAADREFHAALVACSGFDGVTAWGSVARAHLDRVRALSHGESGVLESRIAEHRAIVEALREGDLPAADEVLASHLRSVLGVVDALCARYPLFFSGTAEPPDPMAARITIGLRVAA